MNRANAFTGSWTLPEEFWAPISCTLAEITVRPGRESDSPSIARLQVASPEAAQWPVGDYSNYNVLVALMGQDNGGKDIAGFCAYRQTLPDEAELLNIAVDPAQRRSGIASVLIQTLLECARGDIFLEVAENNHPAISLYLKYGWKAISTRPGYYSNGKINAVVMKKSSC